MSERKQDKTTRSKSVTRKKELIEILRFFVYYDPRRSDRWIRQRSLYGALERWAASQEGK